MARNLPQRFPQARQPNAWRHLRALDCDIEKQVAVNLSVKAGNLGAPHGGDAIGTAVFASLADNLDRFVNLCMVEAGSAQA
ncbi:hypothetical protein IVB18_48170 [Bradyrhizobium sp. 186]|uniref:hypothetical protein n=1 Tax=Bradyrhizobium sp. 186 TaxID=2782654 RepID=UPI002000990A|nr:hypothetical protein [Bradyrhizobium sp. 186]UPK35628.1 hypothetical protein IVB18_48170 [Bradyrhizobium sp. 186]